MEHFFEGRIIRSRWREVRYVYPIAPASQILQSLWWLRLEQERLQFPAVLLPQQGEVLSHPIREHH
ncbi:hypothetical protein D3C81_1860530 [compost metagenome]